VQFIDEFVPRHNDVPTWGMAEVCETPPTFTEFHQIANVVSELAKE
jgi:hypothetical protein